LHPPHLGQLLRHHGAAAVRDGAAAGGASGRLPVERARGKRGARMTAEILINISPREARAALVENGVLQEIFLERANKRGLISNIYKGRVSRVLPGMQAAFVDI